MKTKYIISPVTTKAMNNLYGTHVYYGNFSLMQVYGNTQELSRLNAIKISMLLAINEAEKMNGKIK